MNKIIYFSEEMEIDSVSREHSRYEDHPEIAKEDYPCDIISLDYLLDLEKASAMETLNFD